MTKKETLTRTSRRIRRELQRHKFAILLVLQAAIALSLLFFLFVRKNNLLHMAKETTVPISDLLAAFAKMDEEVDECLTYKTRKEQNEAFASIDTIENAKPVRMSETTAVFKYEVDSTQLEKIKRIADSTQKTNRRSESTAEQSSYVIVKRVILKTENKPEEEEIALCVKNKHIVKTYFSHRTKYTNYEGTQQEILWLVMEQLDQKLITKEINRNEGTIREIATDILHGLEYMHGHGIVHLDLKLANVMGKIEEDEGIERMVYKIIDFGFSRKMPRNTKEKVYEGRSYGTFPYKPPEVWKESIHGYAADVWCLGAMTLFMANKDTTYFQKKDVKKNENNRDHAKYREFIEGKLMVPVHNEVSAELVDFIHRCMQRNRAQRWTVKQLLHHPFVLGKRLPREQREKVSMQYYV